MTYEESAAAIDRLRAVWIAAVMKQEEAKEWADRAFALRILAAFKRRLQTDPEFRDRVASRKGLPAC
jgi:hypothetical protein